jgi:hypothetical protein
LCLSNVSGLPASTEIFPRPQNAFCVVPYANGITADRIERALDDELPCVILNWCSFHLPTAWHQLTS